MSAGLVVAAVTAVVVVLALAVCRCFPRAWAWVDRVVLTPLVDEQPGVPQPVGPAPVVGGLGAMEFPLRRDEQLAYAEIVYQFVETPHPEFWRRVRSALSQENSR